MEMQRFGLVARVFNTNAHGGVFDVATIISVWSKAQINPGQDPTLYRKDCCGAWMSFVEYGSGGEFGWEVDHIKPVVVGGDDRLSNLQPMHWKNNRHKSDAYPSWLCSIKPT
jgi:hypothetical protein